MLGRHLTGIRNRVGLTVRQAQRLTGIPRRTLYAYESGAARPAPERLGTLLDAYDATDSERLDALTYYTTSPQTRTSSGVALGSNTDHPSAPAEDTGLGKA